MRTLLNLFLISGCLSTWISGADQAPVSIDIACGDVPHWWSGFSATWLGQTLTDPATSNEQELLNRALKQLRTDTGFALPMKIDEISAARGLWADDGNQCTATYWQIPSNKNLFTDIDAAIERQKQAKDQYQTAERAWVLQYYQSGDSKNKPAAPNSIPVQRVNDHFEFAHPSTFSFEFSRRPIWSARVDEQMCTWWYDKRSAAPLTCEQPMAEPTVMISVNIPHVLADAGLPVFAATNSDRDLCRWKITPEGLDLVDEVNWNSELSALKPVNTASLLTDVPTTALSLTAIGLHGPEVITWLDASVAAHPPMTLAAPWRNLIATISGTVWLAVTDGQPLPDLVIGIPATPATDQALSELCGREITSSATQPITTIPSAWFRSIALRRTETAWLIATDPAALQRLGQSQVPEIPLAAPDLLAYGWQDNARWSSLIASKATLAELALKTQSLFANQTEDPADRANREQQQALLGLAARWSTCLAKNPRDSQWELRRHEKQVRLTGRNTSIAFTTFPIGLAWWRYVVPIILPDAALRSPYLTIAQQIRTWGLVDDPVGSWANDSKSEQLQHAIVVKQYPWAQQEAVMRLRYASGTQSRAQALADIMSIVPQKNSKALWSYTQEAFASNKPELQQQALFALAQVCQQNNAINQQQSDLFIQFFNHPDPVLRRASLTALLPFADQLVSARQKQMTGKKAPDKSITLPPVFFHLASKQLEQETDDLLRVGYLQLLSGFDQPELIPIALKELTNTHVATRGIAGYALLSQTNLPDDVLHTVLSLLFDEGKYENADLSLADALTWHAMQRKQTDAILSALEQRFTYLCAHHFASPYFEMLLSHLARHSRLPVYQFIIAQLDRPDLPQAKWNLYILTLGYCPLPEAEKALAKHLRNQADSQNRSHIAVALTIRTTLSSEVVDLLIPFIKAETFSTRKVIYTCLHAVTLTQAQQTALAELEQQAINEFGPNAFGKAKSDPGFAQPKPVEVNDF